MVSAQWEKHFQFAVMASLPTPTAPLEEEVPEKTSDEPPPKPFFGCDQVTLYQPQPDGAFLRTRKTVCEKEPGTQAVGRDTAGNPIYYVTTHAAGRSVLQALDHEGHTVFSCPSPRGKFEEIALDETSNRLFANCGRYIVSLDPHTGQQEGMFDYESYSNGHRMLVSNGHVAALLGKEVALLNADLKPQHKVSVGFDAHEMRTLADGSLACWGDRNGTGYAVILADVRKKPYKSDQVVPNSATVDAHGNFWCIENPDLGRFPDENKWTCTVVKYDATAASVRRFEAPARAEEVYPLRNGSYLVTENRSSRRWLNLFAADGSTLARWKYQSSGYEQRLILDPQERFAYMSLEASTVGDSEHGERHLYRIPLQVERASKRVAKLEPIYVQKDPDHSFIPAVLGNGSTLISTQQGFVALDAQGQQVGQWRSAREAAAACDLVSREVFPPKINFTMTSTDEEPIRRELERLDFGAWPSLKAIYSAYDGALNFQQVLGEKEALAEMGFPDREAYRQYCVQAGEIDQDFAAHLAVRGSYEQPYADVFDSRLKVTERKSDVLMPPSKLRDFRRTVFEVPADRGIVAAAAFRAGESYYAAIGTDDGLFYWYDGRYSGEAEHPPSFDVGSHIHDVRQIDDHTVRALAADGSAVIIHPALPPDQVVRGRTVTVAPEAPAEKIVVSGDSIRIGNLRIQRRS